MSKQSDYTAEEWDNIVSAPMFTGLYVTSADLSGPIGMIKESMAVMKAVFEAAEGSQTELIKGVADEIKARQGKFKTPDISGKDTAGMRALLLDQIKGAAAAVAHKSPGEGDEYRKWLMALAHKSAEAAKEGGFLGFGGTQVSEDEGHALRELASALGQ